MATTSPEILDQLCSGIMDNPYLGGHFPHPKQLWFLRESLIGALTLSPKEVYEALYGGAAMGGKSDCVLMAVAQMAFLYPGSSSVIIRRTMGELTKPGALLNRALQWWSPDLGVKWNGQTSLFRFPNGSQVQMGYHHHSTHDDQYTGGEYQLAIFDELTEWPFEHAWMHLRSRIRRPQDSGWPLRLLSTSNPGGPGHSWVKTRFVGNIDPETGKRVKAPFRYFPATIDDNPTMDREAYKANLGIQHPTRMEQLMLGNWDAKDPGDFFRVEWFGPLLDPDTETWPPSECVRVRSWDLAASEKKTASETAGVRMARNRRGVRAIEHCVSFRMVPGARDARILQVAKADGPSVVQHLEVEPGSGGIAQVDHLERLLKRAGSRVDHDRPKSEMTEAEAIITGANPEHAKGKAGRALPVSACLYRGYVRRGDCPDTGDSDWGVDAGKGVGSQKDGLRLFAGPWVQAYLDDMEGFPQTEGGNSQKIVRADKADATSGAWKYLEVHAFGLRTPGLARKKEPPAELHNIHPEERPEPRDSGKDRGGRWRP